MFHNRFLFQRFGVTWTVAKCLAVMGPLAMVVGALMFAVLVRHLRLRSYRLTAEQAARLMMDPRSTSIVGQDMPPAMNMKVWGARGVGIKISFNIDSLRNAVKRGDWLTFCLQPAMLTSFIVGVWMLFMAAAAAFPTITVAFSVVVTVFLGLIMGVFLFMPWAALYTKIDLGADSDTPGTKPASQGADGR